MDPARFPSPPSLPALEQPVPAGSSRTAAAGAAMPAPARRRRKAARPSELVAAALDLFVERGFTATRLEDVAARAGVAKGTLYVYFDSKESLFKAVVEEAIVPELVAAELVMANHRGSAAEVLRELTFFWWQHSGATRLAGVPRLMVAESGNFPDLVRYYHDHVMMRGRALLGSVLARGIEAGEFRPVDIDTAIDLIIAPVVMLHLWRSSVCAHERAIDPDRYLAMHCDLIIRSLTPERSGT
jgi:AcrR family transcriptional regulator